MAIETREYLKGAFDHARKLGVTISHFNRVRKGERNSPRIVAYLEANNIPYKPHKG